MVFNGFSRSGSATINNIGGCGAGAGGGQTVFHNDAGVGNGSTINNYGGSASTAHGGTTSFLESSGSLDSATINNYAGSVSGADGGETIFGVNTLDGGVNSGTINNFGSSVSGALAGHTEFNELTVAVARSITLPLQLPAVLAARQNSTKPPSPAAQSITTAPQWRVRSTARHTSSTRPGRRRFSLIMMALLPQTPVSARPSSTAVQLPATSSRSSTIMLAPQ